MTVRDADGLPRRATSTGMPPDAELERGIAALAANTAALAGAPTGEDYSGPVLFEGVAAAQIFAEMLGRNLALDAPPGRSNPAAPGAFPDSELEGRLGARILPEWMDVVDDPTQTEWRGRPLFGHYEVDREGVVAHAASRWSKRACSRISCSRASPCAASKAPTGAPACPAAFGANARGHRQPVRARRRNRLRWPN